MLEKFSSSKQFIRWVVKQLNEGDAQTAGKAFEEYTQKWHKAFGDYLHVFDANNIHDIPPVYLDKLDAWDLLNKGANSFGIDKVCVTRHHEIDVHQDKSSLHTDKNLSAKKAEGMMSLRNNPLKNIRHFVVNTTAQDLSHYKNVWKDQTPITYGYDAFVPDEGDAEAVERDKQFWKNIKAEAKGKPIVNIYAFKSRGPEQDAYILAGVNYGRTQLQQSGYAKWLQKGVGALGKSVLDPVMLAELEDEFKEDLTGTPTPVSIHWFHSSKTLPKNGWEAVQRRRAKGIYDEVIVISGTEVIDGESDSNLNSRFEKTIKVSDAVVKIKKALDNGKSVLLLALYHHAEQVARVKEQLNNYYPGFKFWYRCRDEADWPCSNVNSSYASALDDRTESVITFGSSGTERIGKDPVNDYGTNNVQIHGPCVHNFTWGEAEDSDLVKKLMLIMPGIKESEIAELFPEFVNKDGRVDWNLRVDGVPVDQVYPTAKMIADLVMFARALAEFPEIKRVLTFAHTRKTNKLMEVNFPWVADKVLDNSSVSREVKKIFFQILNDDFDSGSIKDHNLAIKQAKNHERYAIGSSKVFSRGYDDKFSPKHHAGIHWDEKNLVTAVQEIWRFTRLDLNEKDQPYCGDPNAYYIIPMIYNDLGNEPSWSEERLRTLQGILQLNKNIYDEFETLVQTPGSKRKRKTKEKGSRFWIPEGFDVEAFNHLVTFTAATSKGEIFNSVAIDAHNWLLQEYLKLDEPENAQQKGKVNKEFYKVDKFKPLMYGRKNITVWRERFWAGTYTTALSEEAVKTIDANLVEYKLHCDKQRGFIEKRKQDIRKIVQEDRMRQIDPHSNFSGYNEKIKKKYNVDQEKSHWLTGSYCKDIIKDKTIDKHIIKNNVPIVYKVIAEQAHNAECLNEWAEMSLEALKDYDLSLGSVNRSTIKTRFIRQHKHIDVLTKEQQEHLSELEKMVKNRSNIRGKFWINGTFVQPKKSKRELTENTIEWLKNRTPYVDTWEVQTPMSEERKKKIGEANRKAYAKKKKETA